MAHTFVHAATLRPGPGADPRAPGGAITRALCGSWDHGDHPCMWPHLTDTEAAGPNLLVRMAVTWTVVSSGPVDPSEWDGRGEGG